MRINVFSHKYERAITSIYMIKYSISSFVPYILSILYATQYFNIRIKKTIFSHKNGQIDK